MTGGTVTPGQYLVAGIGNYHGIGIWNISGGQVLITPGANNGGTLGATLWTTGVVNVTGTGNYSSNNTTAGAPPAFMSAKTARVF